MNVWIIVIQFFAVFIIWLKTLYTFSKFKPVHLFDSEHELGLLIRNVEKYNHAHALIDFLSSLPLIVLAVLSLITQVDYSIETIFYLTIFYPIFLVVSHLIIKSIYSIKPDHEQPFID
jgi:hypothetical protein